MFRERIVWIGLAALLVIGLVIAGGAHARQGAWMDGYMMGRLTAVASTNAAGVPAVPAAPMIAYPAGYPMGYSHQGPGFGGFLFLLFGAGILFFVVSRFVHMSRWRAWAMQQDWSQGGPQGDWRGGPPPWMHGGCGHHGAPNQQRPEQAPAAQGAQAPAQPGAVDTSPTVER